MDERADGYIEKLSKGMRQRIGLAQALLHQPQVLILDEPTIGLDPAQIIEVRNLIREIGKERTVLLSTHILSEAQQVCDRVLIINKGRIVAEDTPGQLQARLTGTNRVSLKIRGDASELESVIRKVPGVQEVAITGQDSLEFESSSTLDARPEVARRVVNSGNDLLEMHTASLSLEEIFLELTRDEPVEPSIMEEPATENAEEV
jgi:ABC-2 type transport system ATP-binding protein